MLKKILLSGAVVIATVCGFGYDIHKNNMEETKFTQKSIEKENAKIKQSTKKVEKNNKEEQKVTENVEKNEIEKEESQSNSNSSNKNNKTNPETNSNTTNQISQQVTTSQSQSTQTQAPPTQTPTQAQTAWEKLGISEYEYYNTPMFSWEEKAYSNINDCVQEASAINTKYGFVTNYGYVSGKYVDTIGCWVKVYVDGNKYYLSAFKALGY